MFGPTPRTDLTPEQLTAYGYRRTSRAHCMVSRIDRPDWLRVMAQHMGRAEADFYRLRRDGGMDSTPSGSWCDHYRRCFSKDTRVIPAEWILAVPGSGHDPVGYIPLPAKPARYALVVLL